MKKGMLTAAFIIAAITGAQAQTAINMIGFGGGTNLPVWAAIDRGFFEKEGLKVTLDRTHGSKEQIRDLMANKYQFATTAFDNIVAHTEGQGSAQYDNFDLVAIGGVHSGLNSVVSGPNIKTFADIKGGVLAVDSPTSGYATVLYQILKNKGIMKDKDYTLISVGGTGARVKALQEGKAGMAIISSPDDMRLKRAGFNILADAAVEIGAYQGSVYATRKSYMKTNEKEVRAFARAMVAAHDFVFNDKAGAVEVLQKRVKDLSKEGAEDMHSRLTGPGGLNPKAAVNEKGVEVVLELRSIYGQAKGPKASAVKYMDLTYQKAATGNK
jgi:ABC-type nitrate/sulfonate/bicarbonate transport system substrate-binding protein